MKTVVHCSGRYVGKNKDYAKCVGENSVNDIFVGANLNTVSVATVLIITMIES